MARATRTRSKIQTAPAPKPKPMEVKTVKVEVVPEPDKIGLILAACDVFEMTRKRGTDADALIKDIRAIAG